MAKEKAMRLTEEEIEVVHHIRAIKFIDKDGKHKTDLHNINFLYKDKKCSELIKLLLAAVERSI